MKQKRQYQIIVDKGRQELVVVRNGKVLERTVCSTGSNVPADSYNGVSHNGGYIVSEVYESSDFGWPTWDSPRKPYGPYLLELVTSEGKETPISIHGTDEPEKLGRPVTHGCIRVSNEDITRLVEKRIVKKGTLVDVVDSNSQNKFTNSCLARASAN